MTLTAWGVGGAVGTIAGAGLGALVGGKRARWEGAGLGALVGGAAGAVLAGGVAYARERSSGPALLDSGPSSRKACHPFTPKAGDSVVLVGDSIGVGLAPILKAKFNQAFPNTAFLTAVAVGDTAAKTLQRIKQLSFQGLAIVSLGSNDAAGDPAAHAGDVQAVIDKLASEGARIVWVPGPNFSLANPPAPATKEKQKTFAAQVQKDPRPELFVPSSAVFARIQPDRIHLDDVGYSLLADEITACLGVPSA